MSEPLFKKNQAKNEMSDSLLFTEEEIPSKRKKQEEWKILIVDDEKDLHKVTEYALEGFEVYDRNLIFLHAYSKEEALHILELEDDIAVILLDVVMQSKQDGLELVQVIRESLKNHRVRILLRTGQPGFAPEKNVVHNYDIDGYELKSELSSTRLYSAVLTAIRSYQRIKDLEKAKENLEERIVERTKELQEAKERAEKANQLKDKFISLISHDLRSPLASIYSLINMIIDEYEDIDEEELKVFLVNISKNISNSIRMINQLLDLNRLKSGKIKLYYEKVNLYEIVEQNFDSFRRLAQEKKLILINNLARITLVFGDFQLLSEVVNNLLSNAIKFSEANGIISISSQNKGIYKRLIFQDSGMGISKELIPNLFRTDIKTTTFGTMQEKGSGLGLPLCHDILLAHNGKISLESEPGSGTTFYVELLNSEISCLLICEDKLKRQNLKKQLIEKGFFVIESEEIEWAEKMFYSIEPDFILLNELILDTKFSELLHLNTYEKFELSEQKENIFLFFKNSENNKKLIDRIISFI